MNGRPLHDAFRVGLAASSASCLQPDNSNFKLEVMCALYESTAWTRAFFR